MWTADPTADEVNDLTVAGGVNAPRRSLFVDPKSSTQDVTWMESFGASARRENSVFSAADNAIAKQSFQEDGQEADPNFNPYTYAKERYSPEELEAVMPYIMDGELEGASTSRDVDAIILDLHTELETQNKAAANPVAGVLGGLVGAIADPVSYIPYFGVASKAGRVGKVGLAATNAVGSAAVSELALQASQRTRSVEETILNLGTAGVLGGGLGYFAPVNYKSNTLHPKNPNNPLRTENIKSHPQMVRNADGLTDELSPDELARLADDVESINAARADKDYWRPSDSEIARPTPKSPAGKAVRTVGDFFNSKTIVGRMTRAASSEARMMGLSLMDPGGTLLKGHLQGKALKPDAESIKQTLMVRAETLSSSMQESVNKLRMELDTKVDEGDVYKLTQRVLYEMQDEGLIEELKSKYGPEGYNRILEVAEGNADDVHKTNDDFEGLLVERGILRDEEYIAKLEASLEAEKAEVERLKDSEPDGGKLRVARESRDRIRKALIEENRKAKPLGRDYGHAQLWNRDVLIENPHEAKSFLRDALLQNPDADWLEEAHDMTVDEFTALRETDRSSYDGILEEWSGDAYYHRIAQAENAYAAAKQADKEAALDLNDALRGAKLLSREEGQVTISVARKLRDKLAKDIETARQVKATREADLRNYRKGQRTAGSLAKNFPEVSPSNAKDLGRMDELTKQVARDEARLKKLDEQRTNVDAALAKAEARKADVQSRKDAMGDLLAEVKSARGVAAKDLKGAKRLLKKTKGDLPIDKMIDQVFDNLTSSRGMPQGIIDRLSRESDRTTGRVRDRIIQLSKEQRMAGIQHGFLQDDLPQILYNQYDQVTAELGLREALEIGPGERFSSWDDRMSFVETEYNDMIADAPDRKAKDRLRKERDVVLDDLVEARDRIRGNVMASDGTSHGWANWMSSKVRAWTYARFGGGFLISSQTDLATFALRHGGFGKALTKHGRQSAKSAWNLTMSGVPQNEMESFVASMELGIGASAHARRWGSEDLVNGRYGSHGIGTGTTRAVTGAVDKATIGVNEFVSKVSFLPHWNRFMKIMAGHMMSVRIRDSVGRFDNLSKIEMADLASVGIGRKEAARLHKLIQQHGETVDGQFNPGLEHWPSEDGRLFLMAIQRDMNRSINTPGVGDTPRLMSTWWGKLWLQFQTFAFTFINRYAYPTAQRIAHGDRKAIASTIWLMGAATNVMIMKDIINGRDPSERFKNENLDSTLHEVIDRSGLLGWTSPYVSTALKGAGFGGAGRYSRQNAFGALGGVNYGLLTDIGRLYASATDADPEVIEKAIILSPLSTQLRIFNRLME